MCGINATVAGIHESSSGCIVCNSSCNAFAEVVEAVITEFRRIGRYNTEDPQSVFSVEYLTFNFSPPSVANKDFRLVLPTAGGNVPVIQANNWTIFCKMVMLFENSESGTNALEFTNSTEFYSFDTFLDFEKLQCRIPVEYLKRFLRFLGSDWSLTDPTQLYS